MNKIYILYDFSNTTGSYSHVEVEKFIKNKQKIIYTHDLTYFNFDMLKKGYDVIILKRNKDYIKMSELLDFTLRPHYSTEKEIIKAHNILKMFLAGSISFRKHNLRSTIFTKIRKFFNGR